MNKWLKKIIDICWVMVFYGVVTLAVLLSLLRLATPYLESYLPEIQAMLTEQIGAKVEIESLDSGWQGLGPALRFAGVTVVDNDSHKKIASLDYFDLQLNIWASIQAKKFIPGRLTLDSLDLTVNPQNASSVSNEDLYATLTDLVARFRRVDIQNSRIQILQSEGRPYAIDVHALRLMPRGGNYRLEADVSLGRNMGMLQVAATLKGELGKPENLLIDGFLRIEQFQYDERIFPNRFFSIKPLTGELNLNAWFKWQEGQWKNLIGELALTDVLLQHVDDPTLVMPFELKADIAWQDIGGDFWRMTGDDIVLRLGEQGSPVAAFMLEGGSFTPWNLRVDRISIDDVVDFLTLAKIFDADMLSTLNTIDPQGEMTALQLIGTPKDFTLHDWHLGLQISDVSTQATGAFPGVRQLSGEIKLNAQQGILKLNSTHLALKLPNLFSQQLNLGQARGLIAWERQGEQGLFVHAKQVNIQNDDTSLALSMKLDLPKDINQATIDLTAQSSAFDVAVAKRYLPTQQLPQKVTEWINQALVSGTVLGMQTVVKGPLKTFPYKDGSGEFEMRFVGDDIDLAYHVLWPILQGVNGELVIHSDELEAHVESAQLYHSRVTGAHVRLPFTPAPAPLMLTLSGEVSGPADDAVTFLEASPLWEKLGPAFEKLTLQGPMMLSLNTDIPLRGDIDLLKLDGQASMDKGRVALDDWRVYLEDVTGSVHFTKNAIDADHITATFMNHAASLSAKTAQGATTWALSGQLTPEVIDYFAPHPAWHYLKGESTFTAQVKTPMGSEPVPFALALTSDLKGLEVQLPVPVYKAATSAMQSSLTIQLPEPNQIEVAFKYGQIVNGLLQFMQLAEGVQLSQGILIAGNGPVNIPFMKNTVVLSGEAKEAEVDAWIAFVNQYRAAHTTGQNTPDFLIDELKVGTLKYKHYALPKATVSFEQTLEALEVDLQSAPLSGELIFPKDAAKPWIFNLDQCVWPLQSSQGGSAQLSPNDFVAMDIECQDLTLNGMELGYVRIGVDPTPLGVVFDPIQVLSPIDALNAKGSWTMKDNRAVSAVKGELSSQNVGLSLESFGIKADVRDAKGEAIFDLSWVGAPFEISTQALSGEFDLSMRNGRFLDVNPGFGRLLGLMSLQGIQRRLRLDFSDVFKEGFSFDQFDAFVTIAGGNAYTKDALIKAPAANITISGRTGLVKKDLDFDMLVQAQFDSTVPAAAVAIANPAAGAAVWLADKLFNPLGNMGRYRYHIAGTWAQPIVTDLTTEYRESLEAPAEVMEAQPE